MSASSFRPVRTPTANAIASNGWPPSCSRPCSPRSCPISRADLNGVLVHEWLDVGPAFCTVLFGVLDPGPYRCTVTIGGGGHPPAILVRASGTAEFVDVDGGQLVGIIPDAHFVETVVHLVAGDTLLLYTDGLTEARVDDRRTRYSEQELLGFVRTLAPLSAGRLVGATTDLTAGFAVDDDAAILTVGVLSRAAMGAEERRLGK
jgi:phosphoserine phosphatase RsbU/P